MKATVLNIGDKIKSFEVVNIVDDFNFTYDDKGNKTKYNTKYYFLLSDNGQERVLEVGRKSLNDSLVYAPTFGKSFKFISWNQFDKAI
jgi:hypothetical protein